MRLDYKGNECINPIEQTFTLSTESLDFLGKTNFISEGYENLNSTIQLKLYIICTARHKYNPGSKDQKVYNRVVIGNQFVFLVMLGLLNHLKI